MSERVVLVTGGTGYVGSALVPYLAERGWHVRCYDTQEFGNPISDVPYIEHVKGDILDTDLLRSSLKNVTDVIHLAAIVTDELVDMNPEYSERVNNTAMADMLTLCAERGVGRILYMSSSSVYGTQPIVCNEATVTQPMTEYAWTKLEGEIILNEFLDNHPYMTGCSVRSATMCGPAPRMRLDTIVNVFSKQAFFDGVITVHGGQQWRSNIHVQDNCELLNILLTTESRIIRQEAFNSTGGNHRAIQLAQMIADLAPGLLQKTVKIDVDADKVDDRHYRMDASKLARLLSWQPRRQIASAVQENWQWFASGAIEDPNDDIYFNTRRMKELMLSQ